MLPYTSSSLQIKTKAGTNTSDSMKLKIRSKKYIDFLDLINTDTSGGYSLIMKTKQTSNTVHQKIRGYKSLCLNGVLLGMRF